METNLNQRYQTLLILWFALLMSIGMFFLVTLFAAQEIGNNSRSSTNSVAIVVLTALGMLLVILSFVVKRKLLERSVEKQDVNLVQQALVVACAMCEASALFALVVRFAFGNRAYYLLFLLAAAGTIFHFPKQIHLEAASYKNSGQLS